MKSLKSSGKNRAILLALGAALLAGANAPLAKVLLGSIDPLYLAALLYLGCGSGVYLFRWLRKSARKGEKSEAGLEREDIPWLAGATLAGGIAAPIVMLFSLRGTPAATASLLLNFEAVATTLIAWIVFREAVSRNAWWAVAAITAASIFLSLETGTGWGISIGALGILLAGALWGLDNNFTRNVSAKDPLEIVMIKGLAAGTVTLAVAALSGRPVPEFRDVLWALGMGAVSYGMGIVMYVLAQRGLGAARTSALFSASPLAGVTLSLIIFGDTPLIKLGAALPLVLLGTILLVFEQHGHSHVHTRAQHSHAHSHDDPHHNHAHSGKSPERHAHPHDHEALFHDHPHMPDTHHRHTHE
jgi:drug/metabolite transporter (DMT)-like permease